MRHGGNRVGLLVASLLVAGLVALPTGQALVLASYGPIYDGPMDEAVPNPSPQACIPVTISVIPPGFDINERCLDPDSAESNGNETAAEQPTAADSAGNAESTDPQSAASSEEEPS